MTVHEPEITDPVESLREGFIFMRLERVNQEKNEARFYELSWTPTLLGWAVVRAYGRMGRSHRTLISPFSDLEEAWPFLRSIIRRRLRHGYRVVAPPEVRERLCGREPRPTLEQSRDVPLAKAERTMA